MPDLPVRRPARIPDAVKGLNGSIAGLVRARWLSRGEDDEEAGLARVLEDCGRGDDGLRMPLSGSVPCLEKGCCAPALGILVGQIETVHVALKVPGIGPVQRAV